MKRFSYPYIWHYNTNLCVCLVKFTSQRIFPSLSPYSTKLHFPKNCFCLFFRLYSLKRGNFGIVSNYKTAHYTPILLSKKCLDFKLYINCVLQNVCRVLQYRSEKHINSIRKEDDENGRRQFLRPCTAPAQRKPAPVSPAAG